MGNKMFDAEKFKKRNTRTSLAVQWLRLRASTAGGVGTIPGQGTKIPHAAKTNKQTNKQTKTWDT